MGLYTLISATPLTLSLPNYLVLPTRRRFKFPFATLSSSSPQSSSSTPSSIPTNGNTLPNSHGKAHDNNTPLACFFRSTESNVERIIFDFRFLALLAVGGSLAGSLLCFLNGCVYIVDAYKVYWTNCVNGA